MRLTKKEKKEVYKNRRSQFKRFVIKIETMEVNPLSDALNYFTGDKFVHEYDDGTQKEFEVVKTTVLKYINVKYIFVK
jgi:hypothetical protein